LSATTLCLVEIATFTGRLLAARTPAAAATTTVAAAPAAPATGLGLGDIDLQVSATEGLVIEGRDRRVGVVHLDEGESTGLARVAIGDDLGRLDGSVLAEELPELVFGYGEGKVSDIKLLSHGSELLKKERLRIAQSEK